LTLTGHGELRSVRRAVRAWAAGHRRDLPWRATRDPWHILVSEVMLQQTQASRVTGAYLRFVERFPDPPRCAEAGVAEVVRAWDGLGYNRRALSLHRAACVMVERHRGEVPSDLAGLLALPGVGPYTARAVMAFAFGADVGVVDVNVGRILSRALAGHPLVPGDAQRLADALIPRGGGWDVNQALFDVGALHCRATPSCGGCPLASRCRWATEGYPQPDPARRAAAKKPAPFAGSDRQGRGRVVAALRTRDLRSADLPDVAGWHADPERAHRVVAGLVAEGFARWDGDVLALA